MNCPPYEQLVLAVFAQPDPGAWGEHLGTCPRCAERAALLGRMRQALAAGELPPVPGALTRAAEGLARPRTEPRKGPGWLTGLQVLVAELLPGPELVPAVRRAGASEHRRLYRAGSFEIDVLVTPQRKLLGQLLPTDDSEPEDAYCTLIGERVQQARLSPTGEFQFQDVGRGPASLTFEWEGTRLLLPEVELPE